MKKILIQLDTDEHPSAFDAIAAYDADVDVVVGYGQITADNLADVVQGAIFPRGPDGLANTAFWVGGSRVRDGEAVFEAAQKLFFEPRNAPMRLRRVSDRAAELHQPPTPTFHLESRTRFDFTGPESHTGSPPAAGRTVIW